jgi:hypothetical protein
MRETPIQPGLSAGKVSVRGEPGGLISPRGQIFSESGDRGVQEVFPLRISASRIATFGRSGTRPCDCRFSGSDGVCLVSNPDENPIVPPSFPIECTTGNPG